MTAPKASGGRSGGEPLRPAEHHLTDEHWRLATDALTGHANERQRVRAVALAIADAEDRVRFDSAYCPDCGVHVDNGPHHQGCPTGQHAHEEGQAR